MIVAVGDIVVAAEEKGKLELERSVIAEELESTGFPVRFATFNECLMMKTFCSNDSSCFS